MRARGDGTPGGETAGAGWARLWLLGFALLLHLVTAQAKAAPSFGLDDVAGIAKALAEKPYKAVFRLKHARTTAAH